MTPARPIVFTPMHGALAVGRRVAAHFGLSELWAGEDGFEGVIRQKLGELGVPEKPVELTGPQAVTVRQMCEASGFIKKRKPHRRVK